MFGFGATITDKDIEGDSITWYKAAEPFHLDGRVMHEHGLAVVRFNESVTILVIKGCYHAHWHFFGSFPLPEFNGHRRLATARRHYDCDCFFQYGWIKSSKIVMAAAAPWPVAVTICL